MIDGATADAVARDHRRLLAAHGLEWKCQCAACSRVRRALAATLVTPPDVFHPAEQAPKR